MPDTPPSLKMKSMLFAQVTDLHLGTGRRLAYRKVDTAAALEACVAHLNALRPRPDLVLFTGDLGDLGLPEEYALLADLLAPLELPYLMVPGNHDNRDALRAAFPAAIPAGDYRFAQYVVDDYPLRLIGLDSVDQGRPHGVLCADRLSWLHDRLAESRDKPTILFMHHPPFKTGIAHMDAQNLTEGADGLAHLVARYGNIEAILCGHLHRAIHQRWQGTIISTAPSPAHQVALDLRPDGPSAFIMEPPACHLHWWSPGNGLITHTSYIGSYDGPHPFFGPDGKLIV